MWPFCRGQMVKYDFQKESKIPYLDCAGYKTLIRLRKRRFPCKVCGKMAVADTSLVKKNHQIATIVKQKKPKNWLRKSLWLLSQKAQLSLLLPSFVSWKNSSSRLTLTAFQHTWTGMWKQSGKWMFQSADRDELYCTGFWFQKDYSYPGWADSSNYSQSFPSLF